MFDTSDVSECRLEPDTNANANAASASIIYHSLQPSFASLLVQNQKYHTAQTELQKVLDRFGNSNIWAQSVPESA